MQCVDGEAVFFCNAFYFSYYVVVVLFAVFVVAIKPCAKTTTRVSFVPQHSV
jgi:hypothetical protein